MPGSQAVSQNLISSVDARRDVRNLFLVLSGAILCAALLAVYMITQWGPTGSYTAKNVLLSPELVPTLAYREQSSMGGTGTRLLFHKLELFLQDKESGDWSYREVDLSAYSAFYESIGNEKSLLEIPEDIVTAFISSQIPRLVLTVRPERSFGGASHYRSFQEVHFSPDGDHYRIELHVDGVATTWAYFYHPGIWDESQKLLMGSS